MIDNETYKKLSEECEAAAAECRERCWELQKAFLDLPVEPVTNTIGLTMTGVDPDSVQINIDAKHSAVNIKMTIVG
jgi:hypothetical protein